MLTVKYRAPSLRRCNVRNGNVSKLIGTSQKNMEAFARATEVWERQGSPLWENDTIAITALKGTSVLPHSTGHTNTTAPIIVAFRPTDQDPIIAEVSVFLERMSVFFSQRPCCFPEGCRSIGERGVTRTPKRVRRWKSSVPNVFEWF